MEKAITARNLSVTYGNNEAINGINLEINKGEFACIIGPNGGGKTTFLNTCLGFLKPNSGQVFIDKNLTLSYVPQIVNTDRAFPITVSETVLTANLKSGLHLFKFFKKAEKQEALGLLKKVGLEKYAKNQISELSGGEFGRVLIARALAAKPDILILDEPTANIDPYSSEMIFSLLKEENQKGLTVVCVTHDLSAALKYSTHLICIDRRLVYSGIPKITEDVHSVMCNCLLHKEGDCDD